MCFGAGARELSCIGLGVGGLWGIEDEGVMTAPRTQEEPCLSEKQICFLKDERR